MSDADTRDDASAVGVADEVFNGCRADKRMEADARFSPFFFWRVANGLSVLQL